MLVHAETDQAARHWARLGHAGLYVRPAPQQTGPTTPTPTPKRCNLRRTFLRHTPRRTAVVYDRDHHRLLCLAVELGIAMAQRYRSGHEHYIVLRGWTVDKAIRRATKAGEVKL